jgi:hypothetical protein
MVIINDDRGSDLQFQVELRRLAPLTLDAKEIPASGQAGFCDISTRSRPGFTWIRLRSKVRDRTSAAVGPLLVPFNPCSRVPGFASSPTVG